jgi:hypothetical protein
MTQDILNSIAGLLENNIKGQLKKPYPSKTFSGQNKPVGGRGRTPVSPRYASGNLYKQTKVYWESDFEDGKPVLVIDFGDANYWEFVNYGRRPGRYPPLFAIDKWARQKPGIQGIRDEKGRFISRKSLVFLMRRSIAQYGYYGINFIDKAINETIDTIADELGEAAKQYILDLYDSGAIFPRSDFNRP